MFIEIENTDKTENNYRINSNLIKYYVQDGGSILIYLVGDEHVREFHFSSVGEACRCLRDLDLKLKSK